jgi:pimeloyl-ACP methyl ester carboxylesterase
VIWGSADAVVASACTWEFAVRIPAARIELSDGAGHLPHLEKPDDLTRFVIDFLTC